MAQTIGQELKEERVKLGITLEQISAKTRINIKYLEAIEESKYDVLNEDVYIKAFIREYSQAVGLNKDKIIEKYEIERFGKPSQINIETNEIAEQKDKHASAYTKITEKKEPAPENKPAEIKEEPKAEKPQPEKAPEIKSYSAVPSGPGTYESQETQSQGVKSLQSFFSGKDDLTKYGIILSAIVLAGVLIYVLFFQDPSTEVVNERPYEEFVNETPQGDTAPNMAKQAAVPVDSLTLFITTKDTSWMKITADNVKDYEFILYPNRQKLIKAKENFKMHIGNAASVEMKLNDKPLNFNVGRRSIRNVVINAQGVTLPAGVK